MNELLAVAGLILVLAGAALGYALGAIFWLSGALLVFVALWRHETSPARRAQRRRDARRGWIA